MTAPVQPKLLTAEEFMRLPGDPEGRRMELYDGEVIYMPPPGELHGELSSLVYDALKPFVVEHNLGIVRFEIGFKIRSNPDRVLAPDVCWMAGDALDPKRDRAGYIAAAPTLAVEVVSPNDIDRDTDSKVKEYLDAGSQRVWVIRPAGSSVTVHRPDGSSQRHERGTTLTSADAGFPVDGFELPLGDLFATL